MNKTNPINIRINGKNTHIRATVMEKEVLRHESVFVTGEELQLSDYLRFLIWKGRESGTLDELKVEYSEISR